jgi:hypothetical protein
MTGQHLAGSASGLRAGDAFCRHHPRKRMIQYSATLMSERWRAAILDRPAKPGDDDGAADRPHG